MPKIRLHAAGSNSHGQLGTGSNDDAHTFQSCPLDYTVPEDRADKLRVRLASGANHTLLLLGDGDRQDVYVAGASYAGQLGKRSTASYFEFVPLDVRELLYSLPGEDWTRLPVAARNLRVSDVAACWETSFILLESKRDPTVTCLVAMGASDFGEAGRRIDHYHDGPFLVPLSCPGGIARIVAGPRHVVAIGKDGRAAGWGMARHGQLERLNILSGMRHKAVSLAAFTGTQTYSSIALGHQHSCLVPSDGRCIHVVGNNKKGQLGVSGSKNTIATQSHGAKSPTSVYATWSSTFVLQKTSQGRDRLTSFGYNAHGQLGRLEGDKCRRGEVVFPYDPSDYRIAALSAGSEHILALLDVGTRREIFGWGWSEHGNLGKGEDLEDVREPVKLWSPSEGHELVRVIGVHAANGTSWIVALDSSEG